VFSGKSAKKPHEITAEGRAFLDANRRTAGPLFTRMVETGRAYGGGTAPANFASDGKSEAGVATARLARPPRGPLNEEQINAVAPLIDAAATGLEQVT
jgi:hypothetical protein